MMWRNRQTTGSILLAFSFFLLLAVGPAKAQVSFNWATAKVVAPSNPMQPTPEGSFGSGLQTTTVWVSHFTNIGGSTYLANGNGYLSPGTVPADIAAQLDLPNGAEVAQVCFILSDNDDVEQWAVTMAECESAFDDIATPSCNSFGMILTGGPDTPGYTKQCFTPSPTLIAHAWGDVDGDTLSHNSHILLEVLSSGTGSTLQFYGASVLWQRTISPAPATATFSDVPTDYWAFRFVEALSASGITAGCGGGNFCPDDFVTRGQLAVFLSTALGLHWPD